MKLKGVRVLLSILAGGALVLAGLLAWIFGTPQGAGWLLDAVSDLSSLEISAAGIEGRLWDDLRLRGLKVSWTHGQLTADEFLLRWQPLYLFAGTIAVREISLGNLFIQDDSPEKKTDLKWPGMTGIPSKLNGWIDSVKIDRLSVRRQEQEPLVLQKISSVVIWHDSRLTLRDLSIESAHARVTGIIAAGFRRPAFYTEMRVQPSAPFHEMTDFLMKMNLGTAREPFQMKGPVSLAGIGSAGDRITFSGEVGLKRYAVVLREILLSESGRRGSITGEGEIDFRPAEPNIKAAVQVNDIDLSPELKTSTHLRGQMSVEGNIDKYSGAVKLSNSGEKWRTAELSGSFHGDTKGMRFLLRDGSWLRGNLRGGIEGSWEKGLSVSADLSARNIDPAAAVSGWKGAINFDVSGKMHFPEKGPASGELSGLLLESTLHGRALTGEAGMEIIGDNLIVRRLFLRGRGFDISAKGELRKRLTFFANISDLSGLVPETKGSLTAEGWIDLRERFKLSATMHGKNLAAGDVTMKRIDLDARFFPDEKSPIHLAGDMRGIRFGNLAVRSAQAEVSGSEEQHILRLSMESDQLSLHARISGAYREKSWSGTIIELGGHDAVGTFSADHTAAVFVSEDKISISDFSVAGVGTERLRVGAQVNLNPISGRLDIDWTGLDLARANQWMTRITLQGNTSGRINAAWADGNISALTGRLEASGLLGVDEQRIEIEKTSVNIGRDGRNMTAVFDLQMKKHGTIKGKIIAAQPVTPGLPDSADIDVYLSGLDTAIFRPWLPEEVDVEGTVSAQIQGKLMPDKRMDLSGSMKISEGKVRHVTERGELTWELRSAQISFVWRGEEVGGNLELVLADYGRLKGDFSLPVPARLPISPEKDRPLHVSIEGTANEKGILTSLFPGLVQESHGKLKLDFTVSGSWENPVYSGEAELTDAGAYLPSAGITVEDVTASARFNRDRIVIEPFSAQSGKGGIKGNAEIRMKDFSVTEYKGTIRGENFQAVNLPHLQVKISPDLTFEGRGNKAALRGEIKVPELFVYESETNVVEPSRDVVIVDAPKKKEGQSPLKLSISVRVVLGDKVFVKMAGVDARLKGAVDLKSENLEDIRASGIIEVAKGKYRKHGIDLDIKRGKAVFAGGPADNPSLDILALREMDEVKAGVLATGTLRSPKVRLYSEPPMPDTDILSYVVLGHPPGADKEQIALLSRAAGVLLSRGESATLQAKLQQRLGLDVIDIESGGNDVARSALTIGKYLSPRLYVSYGVSLFTGQNIIRLKYKLSKRFELQTQSGFETGVDLFYKIDFR